MNVNILEPTISLLNKAKIKYLSENSDQIIVTNDQVINVALREYIHAKPCKKKQLKKEKA